MFPMAFRVKNTIIKKKNMLWKCNLLLFLQAPTAYLLFDYREEYRYLFLSFVSCNFNDRLWRKAEKACTYLYTCSSSLWRKYTHFGKSHTHTRVPIYIIIIIISWYPAAGSFFYAVVAFRVVIVRSVVYCFTTKIIIILCIYTRNIPITLCIVRPSSWHRCANKTDRNIIITYKYTIRAYIL